MKWPPVGIIPYYYDDWTCIYNADCREILPQLEPVDLVLTDPPYKIELGGKTGWLKKNRIYENIDNCMDALIDFDIKIFEKFVLPISKNFIVTHSRNQICDYALMFRDNNMHYDMHIYKKLNPIPFTNHTYLSDIEYIAVSINTLTIIDSSINFKSKVFESNTLPSKTHPTEKPLKLIYKYLYTLDAVTVLDPFMGSGTTLRAAKDFNRKAIGIETNKKHCDTAIEKLRQEVLVL